MELFNRNERLLGRSGVSALAGARIILFGVGGVGSWCAEALIRSGVGHLAIVDNDTVCETNINRQLQATVPNIGKLKVEALKERLLEINPDAEIDALAKVYNLETSTEFDLDSYDYVIDAIDTLSHKVGLIAQAMAAQTTLFSAMGAACKLDPLQIRVASIWESQGCKLARFVRKRLRRRGADGDCLCVYSEEYQEPQETESPEVNPDAWTETKAQTNGSMIHMTGTFGFFLAGLVVQDVYRKNS